MGRGRDFREPRQRGFDDDAFSPLPSFRLSSGVATQGARASSPPIRVAVKWFNPEKGFGFVVPTDGSADAFLHIGTLERSGHAAVAPGATLQVRIGQGQKGPQVTEVIAVDNSTATAAVAPPRRDRDGGWQVSRAPNLASAVEMTGTVKFYSAERGFGFVVNDAGGRDIFVHASALRRSGMSDLFEGQRVTMRVVEGRKGPEAASIVLVTA